MSLKEFNAKQFLLEKGEQVGLGIALTLMVLMLIVSLFLPSRGLMSGSPEAKARPLVDSSKKLDTDLRTRALPEQEKPPKTEDRLIALDTNALRPFFYATGPLFEPTAPDNPARRPPEILTLVEARTAFVHVPIDTYIFDKSFSRIMVLSDGKDNKAAGANAPGGKGNALASRYKGAGAAPGVQGRGAARNFGNTSLQQSLQGIQAADDKAEYTANMVKLDKLSGSEHLARQLQPAHMVLIEGSFPYKNQLDEFRRKLHLNSIQEVLDETVDEDKDKKDSKLYAFRFLGVDVERMEVDANDKPVGKWTKLKLSEQYKVWLMNSGLPFEPDDPKYDLVKSPDEGLGLVMPLLREFHEEGPENQMGMMGRGMRRPGAPGVPGGAPPGPGRARAEEPRKTGESKYPDLAKQLQSIQESLAKLADTDPTKIVTQSNQKFRVHENFNPFSSNVSALEGENGANPGNAGTPRGKGKDSEANASGEVPEHCLVRLVDIEDVRPGKSYRYRIKIRMANPNFNRDDVASAAYKKDKDLESREWFEELPTVHIPLETIYYAVDEKQINKNERHIPQSPVYDMWKDSKDQDRHYMCFQLHRWLEEASIGGTKTPIGDWAIADRVFVARGEAIGRTVKVDLPVWKYSRDAYIVPAEDQSTKREKKFGRTGVNVNFGEDNPENETLLLDFEGGKVREGKVDDTCAVEVLMLSPDGKLLARNSATDAADKERKERRIKMLTRIEEIRAGKAAGGAGGAGGGGLDQPSKR